jgi:NADH pyrophosphatase NudC (nudix superfamily)
MKPFKFCPADATELEQPDLEGGARCPRCGRHWYRNSAPTAGCVIVRDGKALVTRRARDPEKGRIDISGGFLKPGEDPIEGLKREVEEELGVVVDASVEDCLQMSPHQYGPEGDWVLALGFKARLVSGDPVAADDVAEFMWVGQEDLDGLDFAWPHDRELVKRALEEDTK